MFKKDEYIVCLEGDFTKPPGYNNKSEVSECGAKNYIVKQSEDCTYLRTYKAILNEYSDALSLNRSNYDFTFNKLGKLKDWRYATPEEAEEYERLGYPYDVTTLDKFKLPKKWWLKVITKEQDDVLTEYCNKKFNTETNGVESELKQPIFYYSEIIGALCWNVQNNKADESFTEITYNQFLKYVLKQNEVKEDYSSILNLLTKYGIT